MEKTEVQEATGQGEGSIERSSVADAEIRKCMCVTRRSECGVSFASPSDEVCCYQGRPQESKSESFGGHSASSRTSGSTAPTSRQRARHVPQDQGRACGGATQIPRTSGTQLDQGGDPSAPSRASGPGGGGGTQEDLQCHGPPEHHSRDEEGKQEQGEPHCVLRAGAGDEPNREQAVGMRWILTWKVKEDGSVKPKARAVLLGYQDPGYEHRATTAPVMTRQTRQLMLQLAANKRWRLMKGDVSGAFLQGRTYPTELYCVPCDEICQAMGINPGSITRLKKACYGLVDAPLEWYKTVANFFSSLGLEKLWSDSCAWMWRKDGVVRGMIAGHVDDFLFGGSDDDAEWQGILLQIREHFKWGDWDKDSFVQCGVQIEATDSGFALSQPKYAEGIEAINISSSRRTMRKAPTTDHEKTKLRGLLGGLSWHAQQVAPHVSAEVGLMLSEVNQSTVETLIKANLLLEHTKARKDHKMLISRQEGEMHFFAWVDAASQNRIDGGSTQGILIGASGQGLQQGDVAAISPISWHSTRIDRVCRSPGAAETAAAVNGEDMLYYVRYQWSEMIYGKVDLRHPNKTVSKVPGYVITDSRNVYDKLATAMFSVNGAEKKANIELMGLKEAQEATGVIMRWVHSEAQLANALTKTQQHRELELYYRMQHQWRIVEDTEMKSARKRRNEGLEPLQ